MIRETSISNRENPDFEGDNARCSKYDPVRTKGVGGDSRYEGGLLKRLLCDQRDNAVGDGVDGLKSLQSAAKPAQPFVSKRWL
jgi:hypothetical protein